MGGPGEPAVPRLQGDVEHQPAPFNERMWVIERITWTVMAALILLALLGLLGPGPLSQRTAGSPGDPMWIEYERFVRIEAPTELIVHVRRMNDEEQIGVSLARGYTERIEIESISPEPESSSLHDDGTSYFFSVASLTNEGVVTFHIRPRKAGSLRGDVGGGGTRLSVSQFAYP
jgi:hypothetical protein